MTFKVEDKRLFTADGKPIEPTAPAAPAGEGTGPEAPSRSREPLPSPAFPDLVLLLGAQAGMCLGGAPALPGEPAPPKDLEAARQFIDLLDVLEGKTRGNLSPDEERLLKDVLTGLRLQYVQASEKA